MATTTPNFGWSVPTSTDLVKDGATAIETLGDAIDASLVDLKGGTTGQVLAKASNANMDFVWSNDAAGMTNPMTTTGDTIYSSSGSTPARLPIGTTGQILKVVGGVPAWSAAPAGSPVIQVLNATNDTNTIVGQNTTWTDTGLTISITPTLSTSKVLIFASINGLSKGPQNENSRIGLRLLRNSTNIHNIEGRALNTGSAENNAVGGVSATYLDSPATTSSTTYKVQMLNWVYADFVMVNAISDNASGRPYMYSTSSITVMEIGV
jgi:hypothetical protein